jgi:signal peptidase I
VRGTRFRIARYVTAAALCAAAVTAWRHLFFAVLVAGESMTPALAPGDCVLVRRTRPPLDVRASGLVVCVRGPSERLLLKRVVGVPGDSLRVGAEVYVGGRLLDEPYAHGDAPAAQNRGVNALAADEYFVLGDNRSASTDSRDFGPVRAERVHGVAWLCYWPPARFGVIDRAARRFVSPEQELGGMLMEG